MDVMCASLARQVFQIFIIGSCFHDQGIAVKPSRLFRRPVLFHECLCELHQINSPIVHEPIWPLRTSVPRNHWGQPSCQQQQPTTTTYCVVIQRDPSPHFPAGTSSMSQQRILSCCLALTRRSFSC
ncbi:hypothetical protein K443DRAFT_642573 [Laccaria amethystina LaAM-08-1]|uniref:Unplaced genomic scaffold K443scaffold_272, whole genome shotgun sequence n=1 Tax=Laccaria amethystina LaAM-08-1 TaxID=1095629 RepID=A0A0C9XD60_9AGAR|nr:hypothetical protein K443DRAFT_642573 [Laccaria amethystina LaAM-08-1]